MVFEKECGQQQARRSFQDGAEKAGNNWLLPLATNKKSRFHGKPLVVRHLWMKGVFFEESREFYFSLPKKYISRAVDRNRLRRWGREEWKKASLKKGGFLSFLGEEKDFYRYLKREDFNHVFSGIIEKLNQKL